MLAEIKKWGNSPAIRLTARDLRRLGLNVHDKVEVVLTPLRKQKVGIDALLPVFRSGHRDVSERHDDYLYGGKA